MAETALNPDITNLDTDSNLKHRKDIYEELLEGMTAANKDTPPDYSVAPYATQQTDDEGNLMYWEDADGNKIPLMTPNQTMIEQKMAEISSIQMKNAAYLFAKVIDGAATTAATGIDTASFVQKSGDSMTGMLSALKGFYAGYAGDKIFGVSKKTSGDNEAHVYGSLIVDDVVQVDGYLQLSDVGIYFTNQQSIFFADGALQINSDHIQLTGEVAVSGTFSLGDVVINKQGIYWGDKEFYHSGNANKSDVDWAMDDANVNGDLSVNGKSYLDGGLEVTNGFSLSAYVNEMLYSQLENRFNETTGRDEMYAYVVLESDLHIVNGYGIKFEDEYILSIRNNSIVSFSAPGKTLNLGDSDNGKETKKISLQSGIWDYTSTNQLISFDGSGNFPNGFSAGVANSGNWAMRTYTHSADDYGVVFQRMIALGDENGPKLRAEDGNTTVKLGIPYLHTANDSQAIEHLDLILRYGASGSLWHYPVNDVEHDISLHLDTDGEFFIFDKPVEAKTFSINSQKYKTQLCENALFFNDGIFVEGVTDGMAFTGNAYFNNDVLTQRFASGFAGYGWGIIKSEYAGGYHATFDELTVRKKMRVYELEVQKIGATNGSLWVSDSCSGDLVEEINEALY